MSCLPEPPSRSPAGRFLLCWRQQRLRRCIDPGYSPCRGLFSYAIRCSCIISRVGVAVLNAHGLPFLAAKWRTLAESEILAGVAVTPTPLAYRLILSYTVRVTVSGRDNQLKPSSFGSHPSMGTCRHTESQALRVFLWPLSRDRTSHDSS